MQGMNGSENKERSETGAAADMAHGKVCGHIKGLSCYPGSTKSWWQPNGPCLWSISGQHHSEAQPLPKFGKSPLAVGLSALTEPDPAGRLRAFFCVYLTCITAGDAAL